MVYLTETELRAHIANCEYLSTDETVHYDECNFSEIFFSCIHSLAGNTSFFFSLISSGREKRLVYTYRCAMQALGNKKLKNFFVRQYMIKKTLQIRIGSRIKS
jgi:hypothetical protein